MSARSLPLKFGRLENCLLALGGGGGNCPLPPPTGYGPAGS